MSKETLDNFVKNLNCPILTKEVNEMYINPASYPPFINGVLQSLISLGYEKDYVLSEVKDAIEKEYFNNDVQM